MAINLKKSTDNQTPVPPPLPPSPAVPINNPSVPVIPPANPVSQPTTNSNAMYVDKGIRSTDLRVKVKFDFKNLPTGVICIPDTDKARRLLGIQTVSAKHHREWYDVPQEKRIDYIGGFPEFKFEQGSIGKSIADLKPFLLAKEYDYEFERADGMFHAVDFLSNSPQYGNQYNNQTHPNTNFKTEIPYIKLEIETVSNPGTFLDAVWKTYFDAELAKKDKEILAGEKMNKGLAKLMGTVEQAKRDVEAKLANLVQVQKDYTELLTKFNNQTVDLHKSNTELEDLKKKQVVTNQLARIQHDKLEAQNQEIEELKAALSKKSWLYKLFGVK